MFTVTMCVLLLTCSEEPTPMTQEKYLERVGQVADVRLLKKGFERHWIPEPRSIEEMIVELYFSPYFPNERNEVRCVVPASVYEELLQPFRKCELLTIPYFPRHEIGSLRIRTVQGSYFRIAWMHNGGIAAGGHRGPFFASIGGRAFISFEDWDQKSDQVLSYDDKVRRIIKPYRKK